MPKQNVTGIRDLRMLMIVFLISNYFLLRPCWTAVSIALGEMEKEGASELASILTNPYVDILIPAAMFLYFEYFLGKPLGRKKLESIGIPALIGSLVSFLLLTTPLDSILTPWEVSPKGICQRALTCLKNTS